MTFTYSIQSGDVRLTFSGKPSAAVRSTLKANGFQWSPGAGCWWRRKVAGAAEVIAALQKQLDREAGTRRPDGPCWECKDPAGRIRPRGAATPVYCDGCHARHVAAEVAQAAATGPDYSDLMYEDRCREACGL